MFIPRTLRLSELLAKKSHFIFGPRSVGKTSLIHKQLPKVKIYDLLNASTFAKLSRRPQVIEEELSVQEKYIVIDEIQKMPDLLDEVHRLIENKKIRFLLTGSSARKLKRRGVNLLGGRAWQAQLFPLTWSEIPSFNLLQYFNRGGIPHIYLSDYFRDELKNYCDLYLQEEIKAEALTRRIEPFVRFLDVMALQNGKELHFQNISNDSGVPVRTVELYLQVLEDTLIGFQVHAYRATQKRKAITRSKFFFFDIGVVNYLAKRGEILKGSELFGACLEHFIFLELRAYLSYRKLDFPIQYWRSTSGFEVDCLIGSEVAIEIKSTSMVHDRHLKGLRAFKEEGTKHKLIFVSCDSTRRRMNDIHVYPWKIFLEELWQDKMIKT